MEDGEHGVYSGAKHADHVVMETTPVGFLLSFLLWRRKDISQYECTENCT